MTNKNNLMDNLFCNFHLSSNLKEIGFNYPCFTYFNHSWNNPDNLLFPQYAGEMENWNQFNHLTSSPLFQQVFDWIRIEKNIIIDITLDDSNNKESWKYNIHSYGGNLLYANPIVYKPYFITRTLAVMDTINIINKHKL